MKVLLLLIVALSLTGCADENLVFTSEGLDLSVPLDEYRVRF